MKQLVVLILSLLVIPDCQLVIAQEEISMADQTEQILDGDELADIPAAAFEELQDLENHPLNLNTASFDDMEDAGIFTSFQARMIIEYRERFGALISVYELASIKGFRPARIKEIAPYVTLESGYSYSKQKSNTNTMLVFAGRAYPDAAGYRHDEQGENPPRYSGSPWKTSLRAAAGNGKKITMGVAYEKDPGENGFIGIRPEYLTGFVRYRGTRIIEQCILGCYRLQHGLGLVQGTDQFASPGSAYSKALSFSSLKPYAGLRESGFHQGMAILLNMTPVKLSVWSSLKTTDLATDDLPITPGNIDWESHMLESGLHRTNSENCSRDMGYLGNAGIQAVFNYKTLFAGAQFSMAASGLTGKGKESLQLSSSPCLHNAMSIYWRWQTGKFETFGEYSPGSMKTGAVLAGVRVQFNDFLKGGLLAHHYGAAHRETFSSAYASGSHISNEKGLLLHVQAEPARFFVTDMAAEMFWYPAPRYLCQTGSSGFRFNLTFQGYGQSHLSWRIRITRKIWQTTPGSELPGLRPLVSHTLSRIDGRLVVQSTAKFQWQTRLVTTFDQEGKSIHAYAAILQARIHPLKNMNFAIQFVVFDVPSWDHRIYLYEPGLYHQFNFPVYYGNGQKVSLLLSMKAFRWITVEGKFSGIVYRDRSQIGSGNDLLEGNRKVEIGIQIRLKL
ncbi:MAG: helix-hairpin-helix domain-containing protein [Bacteroidota bacterium]